MVILHKFYLAHIPTIIAENTENSPNSSSYTIEHKIVRNSHLLLCKIGIFSSATAIVLQTSVNCSYTKSSKQQLTVHTSIVKGDTTKCYKHTPFIFKCTIVFSGIKNITDSITQNKITTKTYHNGSFFLYKKTMFLLICSTCHHYQTQENILQ